MQPFEARFHGQCPSCGEHIGPGYPVKYVEDQLVHEDCEAAYKPEPDVEVCDQCFMAKSVTGTCPNECDS